MKRLLLVIAFALCLSTAANATTYTFEKGHTRIFFDISHLGFTMMNGRFHNYDGQFTFDEENPEASKVSVTIDPSSVDMDHDELNDKLQGELFFHVDKYPEITFEADNVKVTGERSGILTGTLELLGVRKPVSLNVHFNRKAQHPYSKIEIVGFTATGTIKRLDFGMDSYLPAIGDVVALRIEVEGIPAEPEDSESEDGEDDDEPWIKTDFETKMNN